VSGILLCAGAIPLGLAGGYAWATIAKPAPHFMARKATIADIPASPEDYPAALDREWTDRSGNEAAREGVYYSGCNEVRAAGRAPLHSGDPGYRIEMDGDGDGIACEPSRRG
jgi:hypothetical protein